MNTESLQSVYVDELRDAFSAEQQILDALPKMEKAAKNDQLRNALRQHREQTEEHVRRLEQIIEGLDERTSGKKCKGMKGIIDEGEEVLKGKDSDAKDAALISAAQKVEHYEMALYGSLRSYANQLGRDQDARVLQQTLDEEGKADHLLTDIALSRINKSATA